MKKLLTVFVLVAMCISVFAGCAHDSKEADLDAAISYVHVLYKDRNKITANDFDVVDQVMVGGEAYKVEWKVNVTEGVKVEPAENHKVRINVDEKASQAIPYELTATVAADGESRSKTFSFEVPAHKVNTWKEYVEAKNGDNLLVAGKVSGIISKSADASNNCIFIQDDNDGGYYIFGLAKDPLKDLKLKIGMSVEAAGVKDVYNGTFELKDATVTVTDEKVSEVKPVDYTDAFKNAKDMKDGALVDRQGMFVVVNGVEIGGSDEASGYYWFNIGDKKSYIRISGSTCALNKEEKEAFKKEHGEHFGWQANVSGLISLFDGAFYLVPAAPGAIEYKQAIEKTPEEKVEIESGNLAVPGVITASGDTQLVVKGKNFEDVKIAWASDNDAVKVSPEGVMTVTMPDKDGICKLTATIECGAAKSERVFEIKLQARELSYIEVVEAIYALEDNGKLPTMNRLYGEIVSVDDPYSEQFKNITVTIKVPGAEDKPIKCFRLGGEGVDKLKVGDKITVDGYGKYYVKGDNKSRQFDAKCVFVGLGEIFNQKKTVESAYALGKDEAMASPSALQGVITSVDTPYSEQYKNVTVTIKVPDAEDKPMKCFRLKGEGADKLKVGDTITVFGLIKNFKGEVEFDSGCMLVPNEEFGQARKVAALYAVAGGEKAPAEETLTGVITKIDTPYSEQYKNVSVVIQVSTLAKYPVLCFRLKGEGADKLKEGDKIAVTGVFQHYVKGDAHSYQFSAGCTFAVVK